LRNQLEYLNASDLTKENERLKQRVLELEKECRTMQCQLQAVAEDESTYGYQNKFRSKDCHKSR
jgi:cell division protein FtsB